MGTLLGHHHMLLISRWEFGVNFDGFQHWSFGAGGLGNSVLACLISWILVSQKQPQTRLYYTRIHSRICLVESLNAYLALYLVTWTWHKLNRGGQSRVILFS
jgi:hypothetical protein